ncbi:MAG: hypothetical protein AAB638_01900, partial [Patescibacteria group bacterium]
MEFIRKNISYLVVLFGLGALLYSFNIHNNLFWDDVDWILNNPSVHAFNWANIKYIFTHDALAGVGLASNYYRPFLFLTFLGNYVISDSSPVLYHVVSNLIHIGNGILIFYLLSRWLSNKRIAFLVALIFIIHPLQTEAVSYISGRGDSLSIFFILIGIISFLWFRTRSNYLGAYIISGLAMVLGILSR